MRFPRVLLEAIGTWEKARMTDVFSPEQKSRMEDVGSEFRLEQDDSDDPADWSLIEIHPQVFRHDRGVRQPGEPASSSFTFENPGDAQDLHWILTAEEGSVSAVRIAVDGRKPTLLPAILEADLVPVDEARARLEVRPRGRAEPLGE